MRIPTILSRVFSSLAIGAVLVAGSVMFAPSFAGESRDARATLSDPQWLSIGQVHDRILTAGYRNVEKIERERGMYEARATDRSGVRVKIYINPQTGEVTGTGQRQESRKHDSASSLADCNKRRCRDDLPPVTTNTSPAIK